MYICMKVKKYFKKILCFWRLLQKKLSVAYQQNFLYSLVFTLACFVSLSFACKAKDKNNLILFNNPLQIVEKVTIEKEAVETFIDFSLPEGTFYGQKSLTLSLSALSKARPDYQSLSIYYQTYLLCGETQNPDSNFTKYTEPIFLYMNPSCVHIVRAFLEGTAEKTEIVTRSYRIKEKMLPPTILPAGGKYIDSQLIRLESPVVGAKIRYTLGNVFPSVENGTLYDGEDIQIGYDTTIRAVAYLEDNAESESPIAEEVYQFFINLPPPSFSIQPGTFKDFQTVLLKSSVSGVDIIYTIDGTEPNSENGMHITANHSWEDEGIELYITKTTTIKAISLSREKVSSQKIGIFTIQEPNPPQFSLPSGQLDTTTAILELYTEEEDVNIYYTNNGSTSSLQNSQLYTVGISITGGLTINAISCYKNTSNCSQPVEHSYTVLGTLNQIILEPPPGDFSTPQTVSLLNDEPDVHIYYTLDGTEPVIGVSPVYAFPILLDSTKTLKAVATKQGFQPSSVVNGTFFIRAFSIAQINNLYQLANIRYGQKTGEGLTAEVIRAQNLVSQNHSLLTNSTIRTKFLNQNPSIAASELCTGISRYLYLIAFHTLYPERVLSMPAGFAEFYIYGVNKGYITTDSGGVIFNWVSNGTDLVKDFIQVGYFLWWQKNRTEAGFGTDGSLISYSTEREKRFFLLRDGPSSNGGTHTFLAIMHPSQEFKMVDTYHHPWTGKGFYEDANGSDIYKVRFGPSGTRWLHIVYGYR
jgi:hypothetical protein